MSWQKLFIDQMQLSGIHLDILRRQGNGLTRHIGEYFRDLSEESAWLGGNGEAWERGPYYIDGLIPLAYFLCDDVLITKANKWINSILDSQDESGFFGPKRNNDWWPRAVVLKAFVSAYLATRDERIIKFIEKYLEYVLLHIDEQPHDFWAFSRGMEGKEMLDFMQARMTKSKLIQIEKKWQENTLDWKTYFLDFPFPENTNKYMNQRLFKIVKVFVNFFDQLKKNKIKPKIIKKDKILKNRISKNNQIFLKTHGVNIAMALKYPLYLHESSEMMFEGLQNVLKYHGNAIGIFSSDEHLNGTSPETGIELCTVVEMMYSMEEAIRLTGSMKACDNLEFYAYNALLATITNDFTAHQYVQQVNQFDCEIKSHPFYDTNHYGNTFGIEPNYGCCAANMHQGWPKMMLSSVMKSDNTLGIFLYVAGTFKVEFPDGHFLIEVQTEYPYSDTVKIKCLESTVSTNKKWILRIPFKTDAELILNNETFLISNQESYILNGLKENEELILHFNFSVETLSNPDKTTSVRRGAILFSQKIDSEEFYIKGTKPFHDRGYKPKSYKNISLITEKGNILVKNISHKIDSKSFFENDVTVTVEAFDNETQKSIDVHLKPYGTSILRRTHFITYEK